VLDDRVVLMEEKPHGRMGKILFDIVMSLVFEHTLYGKVYANLFHLSYFLLYWILMLMLKKNLILFFFSRKYSIGNYQFYQNLVDINHAKEDYHLMYYEYPDMLIEVHVKI
jgi:hypothetical protein